MKEKTEDILLYGIRPVLEALAVEPCEIRKLYVSKGKKRENLRKIIKECEKKKLNVIEMDQNAIEKKFGIMYHQGVVAVTSGYQFTPVEDLVEEAARKTPSPLIAILDGITDPGNLGAVIRSAESLGIQGIILPKNRAASVSPAVFKRSAGSLFHFPVARVTNLAQTIDYLKKRKFWVVGTNPQAKTPLWDFRFDGPMAVVIGSESKGLGRLVSELCDFSVSIPLVGKTGSLNVASAATVIFYEFNRQKRSA